MKRRFPDRRKWLCLILAGGVLLPAIASAEPYGYLTPYSRPNELGLRPEFVGPYWWATRVDRVPSAAISGAPLHGLVCSRGSLEELPAERQRLYLDGATVGLPGYRCLDFH